MYKMNCTDSKGQPAPHSVVWAQAGSAQALTDALTVIPSSFPSALGSSQDEGELPG